METSTSSYPSDSKIQDVPPMPDHWDIARGLPFPGLMKLLIYIAGGRTTMEELWAGTYPGSPTYSEWRDEMRERMAHINVVAGLLLATISAFCTTDPPESPLFPYTRPATYALFCLSLGVAFAGLIVGSCVVFVLTRSTSYLLCNTFMRTKGRAWGTILLLFYPFATIGVSTLWFAASMLITATRSELVVIKYGSYTLLATQISCFFLSVWVTIL